MDLFAGVVCRDLPIDPFASINHALGDFETTPLEDSRENLISRIGLSCLASFSTLSRSCFDVFEWS